jgi:hypothetical protein
MPPSLHPSAFATEHAWRIAMLEQLLVQTLGTAYCVHRTGDLALRDPDYVHGTFDSVVAHLRMLTSPVPH